MLTIMLPLLFIGITVREIWSSDDELCYLVMSFYRVAGFEVSIKKQKY